MLSFPPVERIVVPPRAEPPVPAPFPWAATLAPVVMSVGLWLFTRSPYSLMFAALGPLVAIGSVVDGRIGRRRAFRRAARTRAVELDRIVERVEEAQRRERERLLRLAPRVAAPAWHALPDAVVPVVVGVGRGRSAVELQGLDAADETTGRLVEAIDSPPDAPVAVDAADGIGIVAAPALAVAVARALAVQVAASLSPASARLTAGDDDGWIRGLPHETEVDPSLTGYRWSWGDRSLTIVPATEAGGLPTGHGFRIEPQHDGLRPVAITVAEAVVAADVLTARASVLGVRAPASGLPERVALADLPPSSPVVGLTVAIGRDAEGPVYVDLIADGPHALVAGTTGSGKSELLVSWVLALATGRSPAELNLLLIDFKGGAAFTPLAALPHVIGSLSDLEPRATRRAIESLRAELLRRERILAAAGVRTLDDLPPRELARLVIVVDEFAAVVAGDPDLHGVFADIAARGRSLGLHLILCTQRPAGVVRDAVLANIALRISLRVPDRGDSIAMLGDESAARLPVEPRGRAILSRDGTAVMLQVAIADAGDVQRIGVASGLPPDRVQPWCEPLPLQLPLDGIPVPAAGLVFGMVDLPAEQRQDAAVHELDRHGHLLILGAAGAGATTALCTLATSAERREMPVLVISPDPADAWVQLSDMSGTTFDAADRPLVLIDDLDALLTRFDPDHRHHVVQTLGDLLRRGDGGSPALVATARRASGPIAGIAGQFGSRLLLRQGSVDDTVLAGGRHSDFDPDLPPGAGTWRGSVVQVARRHDATLPRPRLRPPIRVNLAQNPVLAVIAARPREYLDALRDAGARVVHLGRDTTPAASQLEAHDADAPTVIIGDPDAWNAEWLLLTAARRDWPIVLAGCTPADHRVLLRDRDLPPPLGADPSECWLWLDGRTVRARFAPAETRESEEKEPPNH